MNNTDSKKKCKASLPNGWTGVNHIALESLGGPKIDRPSDGALIMLMIVKAFGIGANPCTASYGTLSEISGKDRKTVIRHIKELKKRDLIKIKHRTSASGDSDTNEIRLTKKGRFWFLCAVGSEPTRGRDKNDPTVGSKMTGGGRVKNDPQIRVNREEDICTTVQSEDTTAKTSRNTDPRIKILIDFFHDKHLEIHGEKPHILGNRDAPAIKRILNTIPDVDELKARMDRYLNDQLDWMDRPLWSITGFEKQVNAYGNDKSQQQEPITIPAHRRFD